MEYSQSFKNAVDLTEEKINALLKEKSTVAIAIDGRCASGKTSLAKVLSQRLVCTVFHIDDFYLPREKQTEERLRQSGGNIDRERFLNEVLSPALNGKTVSLKAFDCKTQGYKPSVEIQPEKVVIIEGSYSCHNDFYALCDLHIYLTISPEMQKERIVKRNGEEGYKIFESKWIPAEEKYFNEQGIENKCELVFETE